jgi:3'-phosphoadenosine 5'-phosphosulfate sulfotransferase (PAPS reductase)/FAD synthetase
MNHIVGLSGGKDSTAMALRLAEVEPRDYTYICTPTGHELPEMMDHWAKLECLLHKPLVRLTNRTLEFWIKEFQALPNWRQRWCTRLLKIEPTLVFLKAQQPAILYVGLRADEETRKGLYSEEVTMDFPLRRFGWGIRDVWRYLTDRGVSIPARTDCGECYGQRLNEWRAYFMKYPELYARAEQYECDTGYTFRSPGRDSYPASLRELRHHFETESIQMDLFDDAPMACRVCSL